MSNPDPTPFEDAAAFVEAGIEIPPALAAAVRKWASSDLERQTQVAWLHLDLVRYSDLQVEHVEWVIPGLIPEGMLSVLAGEQGLGKSLLHASWASELSRGDKAAVLISAEDSATHTTKARLMAAQAKEEYVYHAVSLPTLGNGEDLAWLSRIAGWIKTTDCRMLVFDPLSAFLDANADTYKDQHVRRILSSLDGIARETGCAIVYVMHLNKGAGGNPLQRVAGSIGFTAAARSVVLLAPETTPQETGRILAHVKCNVAEKALPQRWEIEPILIPDLQGKDVRTARIVYRGVSDVDTYTLLLPREPGDEGKLEKARELIESYLTLGPMASRDLMTMLDEHGISERTAKSARESLGVEVEKRGKQWWCLPLSQSKGANGKSANAPLHSSFPDNQAEEFPF